MSLILLSIFMMVCATGLFIASRIGWFVRRWIDLSGGILLTVAAIAVFWPIIFIFPIILLVLALIIIGIKILFGLW